MKIKKHLTNPSKYKFAWILLLILTAAVSNAFAKPGELDLSFRAGGFFTSAFGGIATTSILQPDGKIILVGRENNGFTLLRLNPNGTLDNTFGTGGKVTTDIAGGLNEIPFAVALQPDGKIVVTGQFQNGGDFEYDFGVVRYNPDGSLDNSFGTEGKASTSIGDREDVARSIAVQADGKLLVGGSAFFFGATNSGNRAALVRFNADGTLDTSFDGDGKLVLQTSPRSGIGEVTLQSDGKIIVAGSEDNGSGSGSNFVLWRLNNNGAFDTSFDGDGKAITNFNSGSSYANSVVLQPDGKIVAAGTGFGGTGPGNDFALARYNADGSLDTSFDVDGKATTAFSNEDDIITDIALQPDGKIVAAGYAIIDGVSNQMAFARYNADGTPDSAFGANGKFTARLYPGRDYAHSVNLQTDGKIVTAGSVGGAPVRFAAIRFTSNGKPDQDFNTGAAGRVSLSQGEINGANAIVVQPDGKILTAGATSTFSLTDFSLARVNGDGTPDLTFGIGGKVVTPVSSSIDGALAVALQPDGKIVAVGYSGFSGITDITLVRYNSNGTLDTTFDNDGILVLARPGSIEAATGVVVQPDGKIVIGGYSNTNSSFIYFFLARFNANGTLDTSFDGDGIATTDIGSGDDFAKALVLQTDGKLVAAGTSRSGPTAGDFAVVRYNPNGSLDTNFGTGGKVVTPVGAENDDANALVLQPDGRIVVGGIALSQNVASFALARYNANGELDLSFGSGGKIIVSNGDLYLEAVTVQPNGKIIAVGERFNGSEQDIAIVRFNRTGFIDPTFGNGGIVINDLDNNDFARGVALQGEEKILVAGSSYTASQNPTQASLVILRYLSTLQSAFDFDGDGKTDISIFRPSNGEWWLNYSATAQTIAAQFGTTNDKPVPADFTGDGKTDIAFWRPSTGEWFILRSEDSSFYSVPFGTADDIPVPADYDGDGKADTAVYRPSNQFWYIQRSSGGTTIVQFGVPFDKPVAADYDGDGKADIAIFRPSDGSWWYIRSIDAQFRVFSFGVGTDNPVPGDYTGDGRADIAVFRPSTGEWFFQRSEDNSYYSVPFGASGDVPSPGDYDGDGRFDTAVFRPSAATWFVQRSTAGTLITSFGAAGDQPLPNVFVP